MDNLRLIANNTSGMVNVVGETTEQRLQDMHHRIKEVASHGVHRGAVATLATMLLQSGQDLLAMATGFPGTEDPNDHQEDIEAFADHAEPIV